MFNYVKQILQENVSNIYRIFAIVKYDRMAQHRNSKMGSLWLFVTPAINVFTYWFAFGYVFQRQSVDDVPYLLWMLGGMVVWFFIRPCITDGCDAIYRKSEVISKIKFPVSILPMTVILNNLVDHLCMVAVLIVVLLCYGFFPQMEWLGILYYGGAAVIFTYSLALLTSVLNMINRDVKKFIASFMRLLLYVTPILWELERLPLWLQKIMQCNPIYYIVQGYRDCFFFHKGLSAYLLSTCCFWGITIMLFFIGSYLMNRFKSRFVDLI